MGLRDGLANKVALAAEATNQDLSQQIAAMIDARLATDPNKNGTSEQAKKAEADARRAAINACKDADGKFFKWCPYMKLCVCQKLGLSDCKHHFESGECPLNKPGCDPAKLTEATELRRRLFGGKGKEGHGAERERVGVRRFMPVLR